MNTIRSTDQHKHRWRIEASDWDNLPADVVGCATCQDCNRQEFVYTCDLRTSPRCKNQVVSGEDCPQCSVQEHETVETEPCFFCENATFDGTECEHCGRVHVVSQPEPPPTGNGELVTPPLLAALKDHLDLHALVAARDAFGRSKYGTGLRCHNGRNPLEDARQELGDLLQYLWQAKVEGRDISNQLDMMARAITVLQGGRR